MEARAATVPIPPAAAPTGDAPPVAAAATRRSQTAVPRTRTGTRVRASAAPVRPVAPRAAPLPRHQEYRYIRADLRRLLVTAAALFLGMLLLLVLVEV